MPLSREKKPVDSLAIEARLIEGMISQDKDALAQLYDRFAPSLYGVVLRIVRSEALAEDVLQEAFVKIWKHIGSYDASKGRLFTWLLNITRNTAIDKLRSKQVRQQQARQSFDLSQFSGLEISYLPSIDHIGLREIIDRLKPEYRKIIDLMYFHGFSQSEVAKELELPLGTVKTRSRSAINILRKIIC